MEVIVGGCDSLVPGAAIHDYLLEKGKASFFLPDDHTEEQLWNEHPSSDLILHYYPTRNHAEFLFDPLFEDKVVRVMLEETHVASAQGRSRKPSAATGSSELTQQPVSSMNSTARDHSSTGASGNGTTSSSSSSKVNSMKAPWHRSRSTLFRNKSGYLVETTMDQRETILA